MSQLTKSFLTLGFLSLFLISCQNNDLENQITEILEKKPEILFNVIEKNPTKFLNVVQQAAQSAQKELAQQRESEEKRILEQSFENPLQPNTSSNVASIGPIDAPITLIEYSDFECPFCKKGMNTVNELRNKYKDKIRFIYKHLPLSFHPSAMISAKYFEAIRLQSNQLAFKFHDEIFEQQQSLRKGEKFLKTVAKKIGVDMKKLTADLNSSKVQEQIEADIAEAKQFGLQGTPGFIINGIPVKGAYPTEHFENILKKLQEKGKLVL